MEALPGAGLGGLYAFVMIMATVFLRLLSRAKIFTVTITAKTYLRGSILVTLALCIVVPRSHRAPDSAFIPPCRSLLPC